MAFVSSLHDALQKCKFEELYKWQELQSSERMFTLHDGPPYANGKPHVGHAINKVSSTSNGLQRDKSEKRCTFHTNSLMILQILKDVTNRYKLLQGHRVNFIPGWDCHGLPIEQKALAQIGEDHTAMQPQNIRKLGW